MSVSEALSQTLNRNFPCSVQQLAEETLHYRIKREETVLERSYILSRCTCYLLQGKASTA